GMTPSGAPNECVIDVLRQNGHDVSGLKSRSIKEVIQEIGEDLDFVFTVCDQAADTHELRYSSLPLTAHWGVADPVSETGDITAKMIAFKHAYGALLQRLKAFSALPVASLNAASLKVKIDEISMLETHK
ncbi:MAG: ArsR family transcriptional regulator, partial [Halocynthiibacter sp.]